MAVDHINMEIKSGENVAIVGQKWRRKNNHCEDDEWTSKTNRRGRSNWRYEYKRLYNCTSIKVVGYVFQNPDDQIFHATVESEVRYGPKTMK